VFGKGNDEKEKKSPASEELVVWTYDSFVSEWGPGGRIAESFKAETGISVRFVSQGDGGALLSRAIAEGKNANADILLGLDQNLAPKAIKAGLFIPYKPKGADGIPAGLIMDPQFNTTPYDYGHFALVYDSERIPNPPASLEDLTKAEFKRKLILMDPRTSTPGLGFLLWTKAVYGDGWRDYWLRLAPSILTITEGWDSGYGLFVAGEAPMVLSYATSPAYHLEYDNTERYKAAVFTQGHTVQIEGAGILKTTQKLGKAQLFMDFMLGSDFQGLLPLTNWMYPVMDFPLPASYRLAVKPPVILANPSLSEEELREWASIAAER
jgi:thiamine transport system substrate-binding protein